MTIAGWCTSDTLVYPRLTPRRPPLTMIRTAPDGKTCFLRSPACSLEASPSPVRYPGRNRLAFGHLLCLQRFAQRNVAGIAASEPEAPLPRPDRKREREGARAPQTRLAPGAPQIEDRAVASQAERGRRHSRRLLRSI